jgi:putative Mn2+ efflux pump MntP
MRWVAIVLAIVGAAVGFDQISNGSQWILLGAIVLVLFGLIIALNPNRRE